MSANTLVYLAYGIFLLVILFVNLLYFFQVFKYRLPGDASLLVLGVHVALMLLVLFGGGLLLL